MHTMYYNQHFGSIGCHSQKIQDTRERNGTIFRLLPVSKPNAKNGCPNRISNVNFFPLNMMFRAQHSRDNDGHEGTSRCTIGKNSFCAGNQLFNKSSRWTDIDGGLSKWSHTDKYSCEVFWWLFKQRINKRDRIRLRHFFVSSMEWNTNQGFEWRILLLQPWALNQVVHI